MNGIARTTTPNAQEMVVELPGTPADAAAPGCGLHDAFYARAAEDPHRAALTWSTGQASYRELRTNSLAVAGALAVAGVRPGDGVAVVGPAGPDTVTAFLGILSAGAVYVPVVAESAEDIERLLQRAGARMALFASGAQPSWLPSLTVAEALGIGARSRVTEPVPCDPGAPAYRVVGSGGRHTEVSHARATQAVDELIRSLGARAGGAVHIGEATEPGRSVLAMAAALTVGAAIVSAEVPPYRDRCVVRSFPYAIPVTSAFDAATAS